MKLKHTLLSGVGNPMAYQSRATTAPKPKLDEYCARGGKSKSLQAEADRELRLL
jgi:hypothetical protein